MRELCAIWAHKDLHPKAICGNVGTFCTLLGVGPFWIIFAACRGERVRVRADPGRQGVRAFRAGRLFGGPRPWVAEDSSVLRERPEDTQRVFLFVSLSAVRGPTPPGPDLESFDFVRPQG